jgi:hypothetical protein
MLTKTAWKVRSADGGAITIGSLFTFKPDGHLETSEDGVKTIFTWMFDVGETKLVTVMIPSGAKTTWNINNLTISNLDLVADAATNGRKYPITLSLVPKDTYIFIPTSDSFVGKYSRTRPNGPTETVQEIIELKRDGMWDLHNIFSEQKNLGLTENSGTYEVNGNTVTLKWNSGDRLKSEQCVAQNGELTCHNQVYRKAP